jgi:hypothetical protein
MKMGAERGGINRQASVIPIPSTDKDDGVGKGGIRSPHETGSHPLAALAEIAGCFARQGVVGAWRLGSSCGWSECYG